MGAACLIIAGVGLVLICAVVAFVILVGRAVENYNPDDWLD